MLKTTVLLVLLTLKGDGPLGVNFVNFDSFDACRARAAQLQQILEKGGIRVVENRCLAGFQYFTKHRHRRSKGGAGRPAKPHVYLVALSDARAMVIPQKDMAACEAERKRLLAEDANRRLFCARSEQRLLSAPPPESGRTGRP